MTDNNDKVGNLKKITLLVEAGSTPETMDLAPGKCHVDFIFGLAPAGMTPFEYQLLDKEPGESVILPLTHAEAPALFEHLEMPVLRLIDAESFYLKATVDRVVCAEDREIVKAMAAIHGCSSACGCGCGGGEG